MLGSIWIDSKFRAYEMRVIYTSVIMRKYDISQLLRKMYSSSSQQILKYFLKDALQQFW